MRRVRAAADTPAAARAGQDMQRERHLQFLGGGPKTIVLAGAIMVALRRRRPDHAAFESELFTSFEFMGAPLDVEQRDKAEPAEAAGRIFAELRQPIIVNRKAGFLEFGLLNSEQRKTHR